MSKDVKRYLEKSRYICKNHGYSEMPRGILRCQEISRNVHRHSDIYKDVQRFVRILKDIKICPAVSIDI